MLDLVLLPTAADTPFDDVPESLRSTLQGLKKTAAHTASRRMLPSSIEERQLPLADFEASFTKDVLELSYGDTEDLLDERLRLAAQELGLHEEALRLSKEGVKASSTNTVCSSDFVRRSESIGSRASRSTGLTSNFSDFSRDPASLRGKPRGSLSFRDYDSFLSRGSLSEHRDSLSFTPPLTPSQSTLSLALSSPPDASPKKHFRKLRGLSMLKLNRNGSDTSLPLDGCPHCPQNAFSQRRAIHKLPCGHRLCTQALRNTILSGTKGPLGSVPSCCGLPVPGRLVEQVMTYEEQNRLLERLEQWDEAVSTNMSTRSGKSNPRNQDGHNHHHHSSSRDRLPPHDLETILPLPGFPAHRHNQDLQRDRFTTWANTFRSALESHRTSSRGMLQTRHALALENLHDTHANALAEAEDKQVQAEADLRASHERENRDVATALKHMEAYCAGTLGGGEPHGRVVTEQDRGELEKTRKARDGMEGKHDAAIRVLRGEQGRRMKGRMARQEREVGNLERAHRGEAEQMERGFEIMAGLEAAKRELLVKRWEVQDAVFLRKLEVESGVVLGGRLPGVEWARGDAGSGGVGSGLPGVRERADSRLT